MSQETLRIQKISGHAGSVPGEDTQRQFQVCKLIDTKIRKKIRYNDSKNVVFIY